MYHTHTAWEKCENVMPHLHQYLIVSFYDIPLNILFWIIKSHPPVHPFFSLSFASSFAHLSHSFSYTCSFSYTLAFLWVFILIQLSLFTVRHPLFRLLLFISTVLISLSKGSYFILSFSVFDSLISSYNLQTLVLLSSFLSLRVRHSSVCVCVWKLFMKKILKHLLYVQREECLSSFPCRSG